MTQPSRHLPTMRNTTYANASFRPQPRLKQRRGTNPNREADHDKSRASDGVGSEMSHTSDLTRHFTDVVVRRYEQHAPHLLQRVGGSLDHV